MNQREIVESYFEDYFGHDLFGTLETEEIVEAVFVLNELTRAVNEFFGLESGSELSENQVATFTN